MTDDSEVRSLLAELAAATDGDVSRTLPARSYSSAAFYELEIEHIFTHEWIMVGRADELPDPGDRYTIEITGEPIVIVRGDDGKLRALSGVCRHRYFPVTEPGFASGRRLTCAYHRWSYGLDGGCVAAPLMDDTPGFDRTCVALPELQLTIWEGFVFVCLDPEVEPLAPRLDPISEELAHHRLAEQRQVTRYDSLWEGNWKAAVENGSESYHHLGLHSRTVQPYMPAKGAEFMGGNEQYTWHRTPITRLAPRHGSDLGGTDTGLTHADRENARFFTIFPSSVIAVVGDSIDWLTFLPTGPGEVQVIGGFVFRQWEIDADELESLRETQTKAGQRINDEDKESVERLQQVVGSRFAESSLLNPREDGVGAFGRYLARMVGAR
jgi:phenylpropionate dioxygenase-like ring-hydroxylating dioxygenase large terminal subunit